MKRKKRSPLQRKLYILTLVCLVPLIIMILYLLFLINRFSDRYDAIADSLTIANKYNINFKEKMDYSMYIIVVNGGRAERIAGVEQPHGMIDSARADFQNLYRDSDSEDMKNQINGILKCLGTLEDRVEEIEKDALVSGSFDENMERLDLNIRVLTELIQEKIQEYIYYETTRLDRLREGIRSDVLSAIRTCIVIFAVILFFVILFGRKIMMSITVPIRRLSDATKQAGSGDFEVRAEEDSDDELTVLSASFNRMLEKIGQLVDDIRVEQINLRQAELKVLQAQINPHFLYNTLDSIIWLAEAGKKEQVVQMVSALSDFFRTTLSKGRDYNTVQEEQTHIQSYLQIQQFRYRDILKYEIDISPEIGSCRILKLTLQPLVENALYHGIKNKRGVGNILVSGRREEDKMIFHVRDDGMGMTPERLDYVRAIIDGGEADEEEQSGFGLFNVSERLKLNYGPEYGLIVDSVYGEWTDVTVAVPLENGM